MKSKKNNALPWLVAGVAILGLIFCVKRKRQGATGTPIAAITAENITQQTIVTPWAPAGS
jgi:hypothetical protein